MSINTSCTHPLIGYVHPEIKTKNGKSYVKVVPSVDRFYGDLDRNIFEYPNVIKIPCGKCLACRLKYARTWANRCMLEAKYHKQNWFVTLTYKSEFLPFVGDYATLRKSDFQKFMKRLRDNYSRKYPDAEKFRYFMCGEYGTKKGRPHYHFLAFGLELFDLVPDSIEKTKTGKLQYISEFVNRAWSVYTPDGLEPDFIDDKGHKMSYLGRVRISEFNWNTASYVARYSLKKHVVDDFNGKSDEFYDNLNMQRPYVSMSNGIGKEYYEENWQNFYRYDEINISTKDGGLTFKPPKYYDYLLEKERPDDLESIKAFREYAAKVSFSDALDRLEIPYGDYLMQEESSSKDKVKSLKRDLE